MDWSTGQDSNLRIKTLQVFPLDHSGTRAIYREPKAGIEPARTELIPFSVLPGILGTTAPPWLASAYLVAGVGVEPT